jgi:hypothetical protein
MAKTKKKNGEKYCSQCGYWFQSLANHWTQSSECKYPNLPKELHNIVFGLLITQGGFETRKGGRQNRFVVTKNDENKLETLSSVLGVYANPIAKSERQLSGEFCNYNKKTSTVTQIHCMPFGDVQSESDINVNDPDLVMKTVFLMSGELRSPNGVDDLRLRLSEDYYKLLNEVNHPQPTSDVEYNNRGNNWHVLRYEMDVYDKYMSINWPKGWWTQKQ